MSALRVVVTGSRGLLGSAVMTTLAQRGHEAIAFPGDITLHADVQSFVKQIGVAHAVIHTAAATDVNRCEAESAWATQVNVHGTRAVRDMANELGARFVYISTVSVFDGLKGDAREDDAPHPGNVYNQTKFQGEQIAREAADALIVRLNLIGVHPSGSRGKNFVEWILNTIRDGKDMSLFTDVRINPLSNHTAADLIIEAIERKVPGPVLHVGTRDLWSKAAIGEWFVAKSLNYAGIVTKTTSDALSTLANRPKEMWLNVEKAAVVFERPMPTVEQELERIWTFQQQENRRMKTIVVIPAYNEERTIGDVVRAALAVVDVAVVVDDCSTDATSARAREAGADVVRHSVNGGYDASLNDGFARAAALGADVIVTCDADGQHKAEDLPRVVNPILGDEADVVLSERPSRTRAGEWVFAAYTRLRYGIRDPLSGMKAYRRAVYDRVGSFDTINSIGTQLSVAAVQLGYRLHIVPITVAPRHDTSRFYVRRLRGNLRILGALFRIMRYRAKG